tara:strand:+ start:570 stop:1115 length:546 start_codon:yes stop_codon:yes gene_type:complete
MIKINMGCGWRNFGSDWVHIDGGDYEHLDYQNITRLEQFKDNSVDLIYASHVIEYFDREQVTDVLKEWQRVLKPNGVLRIAVPNFETMVSLYLSKKCKLNQILGPLYGKMAMGDKTIFHKTTYDFDSLAHVLNLCGFGHVKKYDWRQTEHAKFDDHSQAYIPHMDKENGTLISLNIEAVKL